MFFDKSYAKGKKVKMGKNVEQIAPRIFLYRYGCKVKNENLKCKNLGIFSHFEIQTSICFKNFKTPLNHAFSDMLYDAPYDTTIF